DTTRPPASPTADPTTDPTTIPAAHPTPALAGQSNLYEPARDDPHRTPTTTRRYPPLPDELPF
nr:hypothetical protein [Actinomycetota bacterium]